MNKQQQIEEIAQIINGSTELDTIAYYRCMNIAKTLYNAGYRKLPEDSVVLSREEYEKLKYTWITDSDAYKKGCKETAAKFAKGLIKIIKEKDTYLDWDDVLEFAKQFGIEIEEL